MEDLKTITDIINQSVKDSSYISVLISSCVFIIYTLIVRLIDYFKSKNKDKPLFEISKAMKEMGDNLVKLNSVLDKTFENTERKQQKQCEISVRLGFKSLGFKIIQYCSEIIAHNNIEKNKELIVANLDKLLNTEYYNLYSTLSVYEINDINAATKLQEEWITELKDNILNIVYNTQDSVVRITQLNNYINIVINQYATYTVNKLFN